MFWWTPSVPMCGGSPLIKSVVFGSSSDSTVPLLFEGDGLVWVGWEGRTAVSPFWCQTGVQTGPCRSAISLLVSLPLPSSHGRWDSPVGSEFPCRHWFGICMFTFLKRIADVLSPLFAAVFRRILRFGSLPVCWRVAYVTQIPNGPPSSSGG